MNLFYLFFLIFMKYIIIIITEPKSIFQEKSVLNKKIKSLSRMISLTANNWAAITSSTLMLTLCFKIKFRKVETY